MQNSLFAMQAEFRDKPKLVGQATGMATFGQFLGGTVGLAVAEAAFSSRLSSNLQTYAPGVNEAVIEQTPTNIYTAIAASEIPAVIKAYCLSLNIVFILGVPFAVLSLMLAFGIKNVSIKPADAPKPAAVDGKKDAADVEKGVEA